MALGRFVWHDLMTLDAQASCAFWSNSLNEAEGIQGRVVAS